MYRIMSKGGTAYGGLYITSFPELLKSVHCRHHTLNQTSRKIILRGISSETCIKKLLFKFASSHTALKSKIILIKWRIAIKTDEDVPRHFQVTQN